ncbi:hypothetical protein Glove_1066g7 [Diversispora epigaea]|uniref:Ubiquitin-like domain-containing protein n=1 Tax=Diversispora epigaea TaxID=1348612 RepID=A0A397FY81_9GLOM|nr:hypothetical protein Glove_1066g7 [Diversispora epigaea]
MGGFDSEFQFRINNDPHNQIFLIDLPFETPVKEAIPIIKDEMEAQDNPVSKFDLYADTPFLPPMKLGPNDKISEYFNVNHPDENYIIIKPSPNPTKGTEPAKDTQDAKSTISPTPTDFGSLKKEIELITCGDDDDVEGGTGFDTP